MNSCPPSESVDRYAAWANTALSGELISRDDAHAILNGDGIELLPLLHAAGRVRSHYFANHVTIHILDNVQNGACPEDCGYCGQSKVSGAPVKPYKIKPVDQIVEEAKEAKANGAYRFCMVLSGRGPDDRDINHMTQAIREVKALGLRTCLSAGLLDQQKADELKEAGLDRLNHNLNTSRRRYEEICSTHTYQDRMDTLKSARAAGIGLCSGLIVGMGEKHRDIVDVAYELRELNAESIPVNFLLPITGNPINKPALEDGEMSPQFVLRVLSMFRFINPKAEIRVAAGREHHLRDLQAMALWPANSLFMEGYLLTEGHSANKTIQMIMDAGFEPKLNEGNWPETLRNMVAKQASDEQADDSDKVTLKPAVAACAG